MQGCQSEDYDVMILTIEPNTGFDHTVSNNLQIKVSPNPATGSLNVKGVFPNGEDITLQVINSTGKIIFKGIFKTKEKHFERELDVSFLKNGIYYVRIISGTDFKTIKLVKN